MEHQKRMMQCRNYLKQEIQKNDGFIKLTIFDARPCWLMSELHLPGASSLNWKPLFQCLYQFTLQKKQQEKQHFVDFFRQQTIL